MSKPSKVLILGSAPIISNNEVMPGVYLIWLESPEIASIAKPGQFVMVRCGKEHEHVLRRPLSIHQVDDETKSRLALLFNVVGEGTRWLSQRQVGDNIDLFGPLGNGYKVHPDSKNLLLVAGGIGIAPLCLLAQKAVKQEKKVTLLMGMVTAIEFSNQQLLPSGIELVVVTEDGSSGLTGRVTDQLLNNFDWADQVFACGPVGMYQTIATFSEQFPKLNSAQISLEVRMGCGLGICYGCTVKTKNGLKQVCKDGPVFDLKDILWDELNC